MDEGGWYEGGQIRTDRPTDIDHGCMIIGNPSEAG